MIRGAQLSFGVSAGALALATVALAGCPDTPPPVKVPRPVAVASASATAPSAPPPAADPLGPRPEVPTPTAFVPPTPVVYKGVHGITVWLLERHALPLVALHVVVPTGASSDPSGQGGLAHATASMLDEGAGKRGALELARAVEELGADLSVSADADASFASITVLERNLPQAAGILGDVVARPRFEEREWRRVHDLWMNGLKQRASDADATARVVVRMSLFGAGHAYAHPWNGTPTSAAKIKLHDVTAFHRRYWRPDRATVVAVGDVTRGALDKLLEASLGTWTNPATVSRAPVAPDPPKGPWPKIVLVDRPGAPQSIVAATRPGLPASDPDAAALWRVNSALGGSFTSRLNQDLREEKHWSYGASSVVARTRGAGQILGYAAVVSAHTGEALKALVGHLQRMAKEGLTDDEVEKTRAQARADLVETYESVQALGAHLASNAALGLPPDHDAKTSQARLGATKEQLNRLAAKYFDPSQAVLVVVGPKKDLLPQLQAAGFPAPELRDAEGNVVR